MTIGPAPAVITRQWVRLIANEVAAAVGGVHTFGRGNWLPAGENSGRVRVKEARERYNAAVRLLRSLPGDMRALVLDELRTDPSAIPAVHAQVAEERARAPE